MLIVGLHGYFDSTLREALVLTGLVLLIWLPTIRCPAALTVVTGVVAEASLYTYLTHYQVYALFEDHPALGVIASLLAGVLLTQLVTMLRRRIHSRAQRPAPYAVASQAVASRDRRFAEPPSHFRAQTLVWAMSVPWFPFCDETLLHQRGGDDAVGADQAGGHDTASARGGQ